MDDDVVRWAAAHALIREQGLFAGLAAAGDQLPD
jgi:hypothetical protein